MERTLKTARLVLLPASLESMDAAAQQDHARLSRLLSARVPGDWPPRVGGDGRMAQERFRSVRDLLNRDETLVGWWGWWILLSGQFPTIIGEVSPMGPPDKEGTVEVAYGIVDSHQGQGYATEATQALLEWVRRDPRVRRIVAETLPHLAAAIAVMEKCGMSFLGEGAEPGTIRYGLPIAPG